MQAVAAPARKSHAAEAAAARRADESESVPRDRGSRMMDSIVTFASSAPATLPLVASLPVRLGVQLSWCATHLDMTVALLHRSFVYPL